MLSSHQMAATDGLTWENDPNQRNCLRSDEKTTWSHRRVTVMAEYVYRDQSGLC